VPKPSGPGQRLHLPDMFRDRFTHFHLEIGFGSAEHLVWQAQRAPHTGFIGCEPFINGVVKLLTAIEELNLKNIAVDDQDARDLLDRLAPACLEKVYILFPDPWPKPRHHKRRIITQKSLNQLARVMLPGARLYFASDIPGYIDWTKEHISTNRHFDIIDAGPVERPRTRYEQKAASAGRKSEYLTIVHHG